MADLKSYVLSDAPLPGNQSGVQSIPDTPMFSGGGVLSDRPLSGSGQILRDDAPGQLDQDVPQGAQGEIMDTFAKWADIRKSHEYLLSPDDKRDEYRDAFIKENMYGQAAVNQQEGPDRGFLENTARMGLHSIVSTAKKARLLDDILTGEVDKETPQLLQELQLADMEQYTPERTKEFHKEFEKATKGWDEAEGFSESVAAAAKITLDATVAAITNPLGVVQVGAESIGSAIPSVATGLATMAAGALSISTGGLAAPVVAPALKVTSQLLGELGIESTAKFAEVANQELARLKLEPTAENYATVLGDKDTLERIITKSKDKAVGTSVVDVGLAVVLGRFHGRHLRNAKVAARSKAPRGATQKVLDKLTAVEYQNLGITKGTLLKDKLKMMIGETVSEPFSEWTGQKWAGEKTDAGELVAEAIGGFGMSGITSSVDKLLYAGKMSAGVATNLKNLKVERPVSRMADAVKMRAMKPKIAEAVKTGFNTEEGGEQAYDKFLDKEGADYNPVVAARILEGQANATDDTGDSNALIKAKLVEVSKALVAESDTILARKDELVKKSKEGSITKEEANEYKASEGKLNTIIDMVEKVGDAHERVSQLATTTDATIQEKLTTAVAEGDGEAIGAGIIEAAGSGSSGIDTANFIDMEQAHNDIDIPENVRNMAAAFENLEYEREAANADQQAGAAETDKSTSKVVDNIFNGSRKFDSGRGFKGINQFIQQIASNLKRNKSEQANKELRELSEFAARHSRKLELMEAALKAHNDKTAMPAKLQAEWAALEKARGGPFNVNNGGFEHVLMPSIAKEVIGLQKAVTAGAAMVTQSGGSPDIVTNVSLSSDPKGIIDTTTAESKAAALKPTPIQSRKRKATPKIPRKNRVKKLVHKGLKVVGQSWNAVKDRKKFSKANKLIAYGNEGTSTAKYANENEKVTNTGKYSSGDVVGVSLNGSSREGWQENFDLAFEEVKKAMAVGATIVTDREGVDTGARDSKHNTATEGKLAKILAKNGYADTKGDGVWQSTKKKKTNKTVSTESADGQKPTKESPKEKPKEEKRTETKKGGTGPVTVTEATLIGSFFIKRLVDKVYGEDSLVFGKTPWKLLEAQGKKFIKNIKKGTVPTKILNAAFKPGGLFYAADSTDSMVELRFRRLNADGRLTEAYISQIMAEAKAEVVKKFEAELKKITPKADTDILDNTAEIEKAIPEPVVPTEVTKRERFIINKLIKIFTSTDRKTLKKDMKALRDFIQEAVKSNATPEQLRTNFHTMMDSKVRTTLVDAIKPAWKSDIDALIDNDLFLTEVLRPLLFQMETTYVEGIQKEAATAEDEALQRRQKAQERAQAFQVDTASHSGPVLKERMYLNRIMQGLQFGYPLSLISKRNAIIEVITNGNANLTLDEQVSLLGITTTLSTEIELAGEDVNKFDKPEPVKAEVAPAKTEMDKLREKNARVASSDITKSTFPGKIDKGLRTLVYFNRDLASVKKNSPNDSAKIEYLEKRIASTRQSILRASKMRSTDLNNEVDRVTEEIAALEKRLNDQNTEHGKLLKRLRAATLENVTSIPKLVSKFKGKIILAHTGIGKSFAASLNNLLVDGDELFTEAANEIVAKYNADNPNKAQVAQISNVSNMRSIFDAWGEYSNDAARVKEAKKLREQVYELYAKKAKEQAAKGFTVLVSSARGPLAKIADFAFVHTNAEHITKNVSSDLRVNQNSDLDQTNVQRKIDKLSKVAKDYSIPVEAIAGKEYMSDILFENTKVEREQSTIRLKFNSIVLSLQNNMHRQNLLLAQELDALMYNGDGVKAGLTTEETKAARLLMHEMTAKAEEAEVYLKGSELNNATGSNKVAQPTAEQMSAKELEETLTNVNIEVEGQQVKQPAKHFEVLMRRVQDLQSLIKCVG